METHDMQVWVFGDMTDAGIIERLATGYNPGFAPQQLQPPRACASQLAPWERSLYSTTADLNRRAGAMQTSGVFRLDRLKPMEVGSSRRSIFGVCFRRPLHTAATLFLAGGADLASATAAGGHR
jgi:hypothetical protein